MQNLGQMFTRQKMAGYLGGNVGNVANEIAAGFVTSLVGTQGEPLLDAGVKTLSKTALGIVEYLASSFVADPFWSQAIESMGDMAFNTMLMDWLAAGLAQNAGADGLPQRTIASNVGQVIGEDLGAGGLIPVAVPQGGGAFAPGSTVDSAPASPQAVVFLEPTTF